MKRYHYDAPIKGAACTFGIYVNPAEGIVSATWKVPTKYTSIVYLYLTQHQGFDQTLSHRTDPDGKLLFTITHTINYDEDILNKVEGATISEKLSEIALYREDMVDDAAHLLHKHIENVKNYIRALYYKSRIQN